MSLNNSVRDSPEIPKEKAHSESERKSIVSRTAERIEPHSSALGLAAISAGKAADVATTLAGFAASDAIVEGNLIPALVIEATSPTIGFVALSVLVIGMNVLGAELTVAAARRWGFGAVAIISIRAAVYGTGTMIALGAAMSNLELIARVA